MKSAMDELKAILDESVVRYAASQQDYCTFQDGKLKCPEGNPGVMTEIESFLVRQANKTFEAVSEIPGVGIVFNGLMSWASWRGEEIRRERSVERARQLAAGLQNSVWRVLWLLMEDEMKRQGYGPLLDFLKSERWLNWRGSELARAERQKMVDKYTREAKVPWTIRVQSWQLRSAPRSVTHDGGLFAADSRSWKVDGDSIYQEEKRTRADRHMVGGEAWIALNHYSKAAMPFLRTNVTEISPIPHTGASEWITPGDLIEHPAMVAIAEKLPRAEGVLLRDRMVRAFAFISFIVGNGGWSMRAAAGKRMIEQRYAAELGYLESDEAPGLANNRPGAGQEAGVPGGPSAAREKPDKTKAPGTKKPKGPTVATPAKQAELDKKKGGNGLLVAALVGIPLAVGGVAFALKPKWRKAR